jgi:hypothetical protein
MDFQNRREMIPSLEQAKAMLKEIFLINLFENRCNKDTNAVPFLLPRLPQ